MNWPAIAVGIGLILHAIAAAFFFGRLSQRMDFIEDWKKEAQDKLDKIALMNQRLDQIDEWRDGKGGARERLHDIWNFMSVQKAKDYLEEHRRPGGDD